jgi:hypothetical protein
VKRLVQVGRDNGYNCNIKYDMEYSRNIIIIVLIVKKSVTIVVIYPLFNEVLFCEWDVSPEFDGV